MYTCRRRRSPRRGYCSRGPPRRERRLQLGRPWQWGPVPLTSPPSLRLPSTTASSVLNLLLLLLLLLLPLWRPISRGPQPPRRGATTSPRERARRERRPACTERCCRRSRESLPPAYRSSRGQQAGTPRPPVDRRMRERSYTLLLSVCLSACTHI